MRPISVRFRGFGPYKTEQLVDFTQLEKSGVFLITGETGAGKTTILDAMCYALYGRSSGGIRGDLTAMRCKLCSRDEDTAVEFIFEVNDRRYCFTRALKYARKNINDAHNCMVLEDGVFVPLLENPKATYVNKKAEELIGLTYDQFRQVIILPQGQFEKLLVSDSAQKEEILVSLFRAENWQRIADEMYRRVGERDAALKESYAYVLHGLAVYDCTSVEALREKCDHQQEVLDAMRADRKATADTAARHKTLYEQALVGYKDFEELHKRRERVARLQALAPQYAALENVLQTADAAERIRVPFEEYTAAQRTVTEMTARRDRAASEKKSADEALQHADRARKAHEAGRAACEEHKRLLTLYENAREVYRVLGEKQATVVALQEQVAREQTHTARTKVNLDAAHTAWLEAMEAQAQAIAAYQTAQEHYLSGIGSVLAARLRDGEPCPVCGSVAHPAPAAPTAAAVSEAVLEQHNQAVKRAGETVSTAAAARQSAEEAHRTAAAALTAREQALAVAAADRDHALSQRIEGIDSTEELERAAGQRQNAVAAYARAEEATMRELSGAVGNAKAATVAQKAASDALLAAELAFSKADTAWQGALENAGFATTAAFQAAVLSAEERNEKRTTLAAYRADTANAAQALAEQETLLEGRACPDVAALKAQYEQAAAVQQQLTATLALAEDKQQTMRQAVTDLAARKAAHDAQRVTVDADLEFAKRLQGRSGVSLQRYVLGVMLSSITIAANQLLQRVHGGRYRLFRTDEIAGSARKGGLELEVYDAHHNERRSVTTLSGGEKFLVSLSLAIGLSTVVQAQGSGVRLEAMFIDEGFGSLDRESIADALEVLHGVHHGKGVVGIISHVEQLAETIPAKIVISKGKDGSLCRVSI